jgi:hypothetical protein
LNGPGTSPEQGHADAALARGCLDQAADQTDWPFPASSQAG